MGHLALGSVARFWYKCTSPRVSRYWEHLGERLFFLEAHQMERYQPPSLHVQGGSGGAFICSFVLLAPNTLSKAELSCLEGSSAVVSAYRAGWSCFACAAPREVIHSQCIAAGCRVAPWTAVKCRRRILDAGENTWGLKSCWCLCSWADTSGMRRECTRWGHRTIFSFH